MENMINSIHEISNGRNVVEVNDKGKSYQYMSKRTKSTKQRQVENEIKRNEIHRIIAENSTDLFSLIDRNGLIHYVSPSFQTLLDYDLSSIEKDNLFEKIHPDDQDTIRRGIMNYSCRTLKNSLQIEFRLLHKQGYYIDVEANIDNIKEQSFSKDDLLVVVMRDIRDRKEAEQAVYQLAFHDSLTNLPNRRSFMNQLRNEMLNSKLSRSKMSILFIDLDNFKSINDQWGHDGGDLVLIETAKMIQSVIRPKDVAARLGGDEFIVMLKDVQDEQDTIAIVQRFLKKFQNPIKVGDQAYTITCSIGVANYPEYGESPEELIKNADTALYYIKERGKNDFMIFNQTMANQSLERRLLESALRKGIKEQQFYLEYQPKINISTNELYGMEALVRWNHPDLGIIPPGKFISLAEETGLIIPLGEWILRESCRQTVAWHAEGYPPLVVSVNVSVRQLEDSKFIEKVEAIINETGLNPKWLEFEVTESVLADIKSTVSVLKEIQKLGIQISIDDFGTGYSSLSYIKELPINTLKLDQSFVKDIHMNEESKAIAKAIINLANSIGLNVIAEGIELQEHVDELNKDGYSLGQGYYYSRPLKVEAFKDFMNSSFTVS
ncbi:EAL domain-containing protein [Neobacillus sp. FSL H8-0543]|uniref:putative bifunctional diguanylate cyclase/phosphodiesterase n=1 Tax=Neobacillus sp. FSL H8-0543 TaxID=2954672 RepID=UPI00315819FB